VDRQGSPQTANGLPGWRRCFQQMGCRTSRAACGRVPAPWPAGRMGVDIVWYGDPTGLYTIGPKHAHFPATTYAIKGSMDLEVLFLRRLARWQTVERSDRRDSASVTSPSRATSGTPGCYTRVKTWFAAISEYGTMTLRTLQENRIAPRTSHTPARFGLFRLVGPLSRMLDLLLESYLDGTVSVDTAG